MAKEVTANLGQLQSVFNSGELHENLVSNAGALFHFCSSYSHALVYSHANPYLSLFPR
jgi:hypothetical protein